MLHIFKCVNIFIFIFLLSFDNCTQNLNNLFIVEYFFYRAPSIVVGFTCDHDDSNVELIKKFSDIKLQSTVLKLEKNIKLSKTAKAIYYKLGIFMDLRCQLSENIKLVFNEATNHKMFDELYYWLILGSNLSECLSFIKDDSFGLSTDFVVAIFEKNQYVLYDIYNPCKSHGGVLNITHLGIWNKRNGLNISLKINKIRRWNLQGMTLKIGGLIKRKPWNMSIIKCLYNYNFKQFDLMTKFGYGLWIYLAEMFNFTLDYHEYLILNNSIENNPIITALINDEIDVSGTADAMTNDRITLVKDVYQAFLYRTFFIFRSTSSDRLNVRDIFLPLSSTVWYLTIGLTVLSIHVLVFLLIFTEQNFYKNFFRSILIHVSAFCQQGIEFSPYNLSGRIAILHILLFNLLLYNYYLASAVSNRLSKPTVSINDSLHELKKKHFQYASEPMLDFNHHIKKNNCETQSFYINKWVKIPESQRFMSPEKGMASVLKGGFAYHTHPEISYPYIGRYFDDRKICELQEVHLIRPIQLSILVQINSSFTEMFKAGFLKLSEVGIRYRQIQIMTVKKPNCRSDLLTADSITINEIEPAIIFLLFSILVSITLLTIEFLFSVYYKK